MIKLCYTWFAYSLYNYWCLFDSVESEINIYFLKLVVAGFAILNLVESLN